MQLKKQKNIFLQKTKFGITKGQCIFLQISEDTLPTSCAHKFTTNAYIIQAKDWESKNTAKYRIQTSTTVPVPDPLLLQRFHVYLLNLRPHYTVASPHNAIFRWPTLESPFILPGQCTTLSWWIHNMVACIQLYKETNSSLPPGQGPALIRASVSLLLPYQKIS